MSKIMDKVRSFINQKSLLGEIVRFVLVGGISTVVDFITMAVVLYVDSPEKYDSFINVFFGSQDPSSFAALLGTGLGFSIGVVINYLLSILFVFNENGKVRTVKGFLLFTLLSLGGLLLHEGGMWLFHIKIGVNEWIVKIILTIVVMAYNFITRRLILFNKKTEEKK